LRSCDAILLYYNCGAQTEHEEDKVTYLAGPFEVAFAKAISSGSGYATTGNSSY
jgi:hypothetical protein